MSIVAVIPARYDSSRFPGKPLARATGKYLIQHVYEQVLSCKQIDQVIIATDDERIRRAAEEFSAESVMTRADHASGTDRVAEVAAGLRAEIIVNVQGDEPEIESAALETLIGRLESEPEIRMATLARPFAANEDPTDPNLVKVVLDDNGYAMYFSRSVMPHGRGFPDGVAEAEKYLLHLGVYGYRRDFLLEFAKMPASKLEKLERLEQLRALQAGVRIAVDVVSYLGAGIDTPEEYEAWVSSKNRQPAKKEKG